jgi:UDP-2,3-diacylglucosamine hydrolase
MTSGVGLTPPVLQTGLDRVALRAPVFISDLHLCLARPATVQGFRTFVEGLAGQEVELVILGDLFEYWAGDDSLAQSSPDDLLGQEIAAALRGLVTRGVPVYVMRGNRDVLLGEGFLAGSGAQLLADPALARLGSGANAWDVILAHGDAYCTLDTAYQAFRKQARDPKFQATFLQHPLAQRRAMIGQGREQSEAEKQKLASQIMDVTTEAIDEALRGAGRQVMVHGHTHLPARHEYALDGAIVQRWVLPDWDLDVPAGQRRGGGLRWTEGGLARFSVA